MLVVVDEENERVLCSLVMPAFVVSIMDEGLEKSVIRVGEIVVEERIR